MIASGASAANSSRGAVTRTLGAIRPPQINGR
jgi:hypothetical protein